MSEIGEKPARVEPANPFRQPIEWDVSVSTDEFIAQMESAIQRLQAGVYAAYSVPYHTLGDPHGR